MITKSTIQIWLLPIKISSTIPQFLCLPFEVVGFRMRTNSISTQISRYFKFYLANILAQLCTKLFFLLYSVYALWALKTENPLQFHRELLPIGHASFVVATSIILHVHMLLNYKDFLRQLRHCLKICLELDDDTRAVSLVMGLTCFVGVVGVAAIGIGGFILIEGGVLFQPFRTPYTVMNALGILLTMQLLASDVIFVFYYLFSGIMQTVLISKSLQRFSWTVPTTYEERQLLRMKYLSYFLVNRDNQGTWASVILCCFTGGVVLIISAFYIVIRYHSTVSPFFVLAIAVEGSALCVIIALLISYAVSIREACLSFAHSFLKYETQLTPYEKKWLKACQPIEIQVGTFFALTTRTFFLIVMSFIVQNVIDLLVVFHK